ncbi:uncharacterized protein LOC134832345 [Culicoides brevitarsis]|uniref:uncharacterized protein LOC134832345 n=1 Tax=Culicoides brevitarsis TaxID=469753 RepID=UPI00307B1332
MSLLIRKCCVPTCNYKETSSDVWFYEFPTHGELFNTWTKRFSFLTTLRGDLQIICSSHFDESSFKSDGELREDAIPTMNMPEKSKNIEATDLFVALFIDDSGKFVTFSLVEYKTVEKWENDDRFEYAVAEVFTSADRIDDKKFGTMGSIFNCARCHTGKEFGIVFMQKRDVPEVLEDEEEVVHETEIFQTVVKPEPVSPRTIEIPVQTQKRKASPASKPHQQSLLKKSRTTPTKSSLPSIPTNPTTKEETIMGVKFFSQRSCNKCGETPSDEEALQNHVEECYESRNDSFSGKTVVRGGQRIRENYICTKCKISVIKRDVYAHAEFHVKFAPYACKCSKCFATEEELNEHSSICGQHLFCCKMCHKEFVKKKDFTDHRAQVHGIATPAKRRK